MFPFSCIKYYCYTARSSSQSSDLWLFIVHHYVFAFSICRSDNDLRDPLDWEMPWLSHDHPAASTVIGTSSATSSGTNTNSAALLRPLNSLSTFDAMDLKLQRLRSHWRLSATVLKSLAKAPHIFQDHLAAIGLSRKRRKGIFALLRLKTLLKLTCWSGLTYAAVEAAKRSGDIAAAAELAKKNAADFIQRRLTTPTVSIVNDVILNKRISITDKDALIDARRSLSVMLNDFLVQHRPKMSEAERRRAVQKLDMRPVSEEYELELRRPLRNLIAGQIAKLVFIQLQFVKKELLEAMQAIDELFNANQVNLQLLAVTPAVLSLLLAQAVSRSIFNAVKSSSRGRLLESSSVVYRDLRSAIRLLEKLLSMSPNNPSGYLSQTELGNMMAILHRIHNILVLNAAHFDNLSLHQMQVRSNRRTHCIYVLLNNLRHTEPHTEIVLLLLTRGTPCNLLSSTALAYSFLHFAVTAFAKPKLTVHTYSPTNIHTGGFARLVRRASEYRPKAGACRTHCSIVSIPPATAETLANRVVGGASFRTINHEASLHCPSQQHHINIKDARPMPIQDLRLFHY
jgi:hypothetical protein